jgi:hypothetical protein
MARYWEFVRLGCRRHGQIRSWSSLQLRGFANTNLAVAPEGGSGEGFPQGDADSATRPGLRV